MVAIRLRRATHSKVRLCLGDVDMLSTRARSFAIVFERRAGDRCVGRSAVVDPSLLQLDSVALRHHWCGADDSNRQAHRHGGAVLRYRRV